MMVYKETQVYLNSRENIISPIHFRGYFYFAIVQALKVEGKFLEDDKCHGSVLNYLLNDSLVAIMDSHFMTTIYDEIIIIFWVQ